MDTLKKSFFAVPRAASARRCWSALLLVVASSNWGVALRGAESFDSDKATTLSVKEASECLRRRESLSFASLETITPEVAAALARHRYGLELDGLRSIDEPTAASLSKCSTSLSLDGLSALTDECALALSECTASISLQGLRELKSVPLATKLAKQRRVSLPRVTFFEKPVADVLVAAGCDLDVESLVKLDHEGLGRLLTAGSKAELHLQFLHDLTPEGARGLCASPCHLYFPGITTIDEATARSLKGHQGVLDLDNAHDLRPEAVEGLLGNEGPIGLGSLTSLGNPAPPSLLKALAAHRSPLCLSGLTRLEPVEAAAIRKRMGHVDLCGISVLSLPVAEELVQCNGVVWLMGLEELDEGVAEALLKHRPRPETGFVLPVSLRANLTESEVRAFESHEGIHFGNQYCP
jgi:hypothetical protein